MQYGHFSEDSMEYIITQPDTPTPWINYISNLRGYCGIVSQSGGGFSFHKDPRDRRITKYRYNNVPVDRPGRYFYIKDEENGKYWSPTWQPVMSDLKNFECRHGMGYTAIKSEYSNISHEVEYFVPCDYDCEVWRLKIKNNQKVKKSFSIYSYSEFTTWCEPESRNVQWSMHLTKGNFNEGIIFYDFIEPHPAFDMKANINYVGDRPGGAFMGVNNEVQDFECVRDKFIGMYRSESNPLGVENEKLSNSILRGGVGCAAIRTKIELMPEEEKSIVVTLGFAENKESAADICRYFNNDKAVNYELDRVKSVWRNYLSTFNVNSPDTGLNTMINVWNQYQCKTTFDWSRYISFYENGEGRGMGTRDSCQDTLAVNSQMSEKVRGRIIQIVSTCQFETGDCYHQYFPLKHKPELKGFSDDQLWIVQMVHAYIAETGDFDILNENIKYADSEKSDTLYNHLATALEFTSEATGPNGLPLILTADWNDTLHLWMECEKPESVVTAGLYVYALKLMAEIAKFLSKSTDERSFISKAEKMSELVNEKCWDGEWYVRGFGSKVIGTHRSEKAKIFLNSQLWCVISGIADSERAIKCMDSVKKYLASEEGVKKVWPPFDSYDQTYGLISRYNTGRKENGIFSHANAWAIVAEALLKRPEYAFEYYKNILPVKRNDSAEIFKTEPYVFCQTICSNDSINCGEGSNSWLTGTASWMYVAATQYLLGIKPTLEGLMISPCIPSDWQGYEVKRIFRGSVYNIKVERGTENKILIGGKTILGNVIPYDKTGESDIIVKFK